MKSSGSIQRIHIVLLICFVAILVWSVINPKDLFTWSLEVFPAVIGVMVLVATYHKFRLTTFLYVLILIHGSILFIGGHYTYAEMPLFNWIRDTFHLSRNHYDRLGHFAQGFIPAMIAREILIRTTPLRRGKMLVFLVVCICLAISAAYELLEWGVAVATGSAADDFLGSQGDVWDSQLDMFFCLCGTITSLLSMSRLHDRFLSRMPDTQSATI